MKTIITMLLLLLVGQSYAQELAGRVLDERRNPFTGVVVQVYQGGILKGDATADNDGNYRVIVEPGYYDVLAAHAGYDSNLITGVVVVPGLRTTVNFIVLPHKQAQKEIIITAYKKPLVDINRPAMPNNIVPVPQMPSPVVYIIDDILPIGIKPVKPYVLLPLNRDNPSDHILTRAQLDQMPAWATVNDLVSLFSGVYQPRRGDDVNIYGARTSGNLYVVDGMH